MLLGIVFAQLNWLLYLVLPRTAFHCQVRLHTRSAYHLGQHMTTVVVNVSVRNGCGAAGSTVDRELAGSLSGPGVPSSHEAAEVAKSIRC